MAPGLVVEPALALLELDSIAAGIEAGDAMAKRAPIEILRAGTVHPGKYLVLVGGAGPCSIWRSGGRRRCETCDGMEFPYLSGRGSRSR